MVDERQRVIQDLLVRLEEVGISPDEPFDATFMPGRGWTFESRGADGNVSSFSSSRGSAPEEQRDEKVRTRPFPSR